MILSLHADVRLTQSLQSLLFVGRASLEVQSGEVAAAGATLTAASGAVEVCADERCGGPLVLEPGAATGTVPLAASGTAAFTLTRLPGGAGAGTAQLLATDVDASGAQQGGEGGAAKGAVEASRFGFQARLAGDPHAPLAAPPLPPFWQQAVGEVEASLAEQAQHGGGPGVIVVCGPKKVGKSTFGRMLVNALLARRPCVAYLDTGEGPGGLRRRRQSASCPRQQCSQQQRSAGRLTVSGPAPSVCV